MFPESAPPAVHRVIDLLGQKVTGWKFYLAGGTALAFHFGHRRSVDLDFFSQTAFDHQQLAESLVSLGGMLISQGEDTVHAVLDGVKCSFFRYPYPMVAPLVSFDSIQLADIPDIAAMKVVAIAQRGTKKDFFDLYEILRTMSPDQLKTWFLEKFGNQRVNCYHVLRSLFYFDDAENDPDPISLNGADWQKIKAFFLAHEKDFFDRLLT